MIALLLILAQSVTLVWDRNPEPDIAGYVLHYGVSSGLYTHSVNCGNVTNYTVSGLVEGMRYYFVATAFNTSGLESDPSNEVSYRVPSPALVRPTLYQPDRFGWSVAPLGWEFRLYSKEPAMIEWSSNLVDWSVWAYASGSTNVLLPIFPESRFFRAVR